MREGEGEREGEKEGKEGGKDGKKETCSLIHQLRGVCRSSLPQKDISTSAMAKHSGAHLDLSAFSSPEELMSLGLDRLKSALMALGLKCGG